MSKNTTQKKKYAKAPIFKQVVGYCIFPDLLFTVLPFGAVLISLALQALKASSAAEFIFNYIALPLFVIAPVLVTLKQINTLKKSFPRSSDAHKVILSVFFSSGVCFATDVILFVLSAYACSVFPMSFRSAAYIRDMIASSPAAMTITFITVFMLFSLICLMTTTAYFMGEASKRKYSFTLSCLIFLIMYTVLLIIFILAYFGATFMNIKVLESIQISNSFFNSSMLCSFVTFIFICIPSLPILYKLNYNALNKLEAPKKK